MKFFKIFFATLMLLMLVFVVGCYLFLKNIDINKYMPIIAQKVEEQIGRKISIGSASVKVSLAPRIVVENVKLANASWATHPNMVDAKKAEIIIDVMALLNKEYVVKNFVLDGAEIYLQTNDEGVGNWVFDMPAKTQKTTFKFELISSANAQSTERKTEIPNFGLENVEIINGLVVFNKHNVDINSFSLSVPNKDSAIKTEFDVAYNQERIEGTGVLGSFNELLGADSNFPLDIKLKARGLSFAFVGEINNATSKNVSAKGAINLYNPASNINLPEITLNADVEGSQKNVLVTIKSLNVAQNLITGRISANIEGKPFVDAYLKSDMINLESLKLQEPQAFNMPSLISSANATTLVAATPIDYSLLNIVDGKLAIDVAKLIINKDFSVKNIKATANINNGVLLLKPLEVGIGSGNIFATASVDAKSQTINANIKSQNLNLKSLDKEFLIENDKDFGIVDGGGLDIDANIIAKGSTTKALLEGLNGRVIAIVNKSVVQTGKSNLLNGFFGTILNAIKLGNVEKNKELDLSCAVLHSDIKNGVLNFDKGIALQSKDLSLVADGYISLGNDKIALDLHPFSENIAESSLASTLGGLLKVSGTIQKPAVALDEKQALKTIVGVLATGGASYVGSQVVVDAGSSPCYSALVGTGYEGRFPKPAVASQVYAEGEKTVENAGKSAAKGLSNIGKSTEETIKSLFDTFLK